MGPLPSAVTAFHVQPEDVFLGVVAPDRRTALQAAARSMAATHGLDAKLVGDALWRREQAASTALGHGFAVPHARVAGLAQPLMGYVRHAPIAFAAPDGRTVSHLLVILVPVDGDHDDHLRLLAYVAGLVADRAFRERLGRATDAHAVAAAFLAGGGRDRGTN